MNALLQMSHSNVVPVMSIDNLGSSGDTPNSSSLNSPQQMGNQVVQQTNDNFLQVNKDNKAFKRGLTEIEESDNEEEDESSYLSGEESDLSQTDRDEKQFYLSQPRRFVMGFEYLPKINRQQIMISKSPFYKRKSRSGPRYSGDNNTLPIIKDFVEMENRKQNSTPSNYMASNKHHKSTKNVNHRTLPSQNNSSDEDNGSFKASTRIK